MFSRNNEPKVVRHLFTSKKAKKILEDNDLGQFDRIWALQAPWFEDPNERREGVSGVVTWQLKLPDDSSQRVFIKRQENHNTRTYRHPFRGEPTFYREFRNLQMLESMGVPVIEVLYYGEALGAGKRQAILISKGLDDYVSLEEWFSQPEKISNQDSVNAVLSALVKAIKPMHNNRIKHGCLYGKHLFVKELQAQQDAPVFDIKLLDLEKAKKIWPKRLAIEKDLSQLLRHMPGLDPGASEKLLAYYFADSDLTGWRQRLNQAILAKQAKQQQKAKEVA